MRKWIERHSLEIKLFLTIWLVYAVYVTPAGGVTPNRYVDLVHSIVNERRFAIDTYQENTIDKAYYDGHYYAGALPGPAFLAIPAYVLFKGIYVLIPQPVKEIAGGVESYQKQKQQSSGFYGRVDNVEFFFSQAFMVIFVVALLSALTSVLFFKILKRMHAEDRIAYLLTFAYAFGTIVFWNSTTYFEQVFTIFFVVSAFYVLLRIQHTHARAVELFLAGFLAGSALLVEFSGGLAIVVLFAYALLKTKKEAIIFMGVGAVLPILVLGLYDYYLFGSPFSTPYQHLVMAGFQGVMGEGFGGVTYPHLDRFVGLLLSPERGILVFAPVVVLGLFGLLMPSKLRTEFKNEAMFFGMAVAVSFLFVSSFRGWNEGNGFGPRYLSFGIPFMVLPAAFILNRANLHVGVAIGCVSILINWAGAQFGFAPTYYFHIANLFTNGPSMPIFEAVVTHAVSSNPVLEFLKSTYHFLAFLIPLVLLGLLSLMWAWPRLSPRHSSSQLALDDHQT